MALSRPLKEGWMELTQRKVRFCVCNCSAAKKEGYALVVDACDVEPKPTCVTALVFFSTILTLWLFQTYL